MFLFHKFPRPVRGEGQGEGTLNGYDKVMREQAKVFASMEKLVDLKNSGIPPKENLPNYLEDGIFELKVSFENRAAGSFYFYESKKEIIFTHGFVKKRQKIPQGELARAKSTRRLWRDGK